MADFINQLHFQCFNMLVNIITVTSVKGRLLIFNPKCNVLFNI